MAAVVENWELLLTTPHPGIVSPQLNTVMSPLGHLNSYYGVFTMNYQDIPTHSEGGMQVQLWKGQDVLHWMSDPSGTLNASTDKITWGQSLELVGGVLKFRVSAGKSISWGSFADNVVFRAEFAAPELSNLNGYDKNVSVEQARKWDFGAQRIQYLKLNSVEKFNNSGRRLSTDTNVITVLPH